MKKWQHGLDGINTTGLAAHYDASKAESLLTGAAGCTSSVLSPAANSQTPECWRDRSAMDNHLLLSAGDTPTLTTSSSMMSGQRAVSFDPGDNLGLYDGVRGFYTGDMAYNMGTLFGTSALSSNEQVIINFGAGAANQRSGLSIEI